MTTTELAEGLSTAYGRCWIESPDVEPTEAEMQLARDVIARLLEVLERPVA